jgi:hypothetical protein
MADVFVSYARADLAAVRQVVEALRAETLDVWWDQDIPATAEWDPSIEKALASAKSVIVCWTPTSAASENVRAEARLARNNGKLLQAYLKPCTPPFFFGERQGADLTNWDGDRGAERFQFLVKGVRDVLAGKRPQPGLGYRPRDSRAASFVFAGLGLLAAAIVGVLWIPELRERVFPPPPVTWSMSAGPSADLRPAEAPDAPPIERMISPLMIAVAMEFAAEGGHDAGAVVSSQRLTLRIPGAAPVEYSWLWFTDNDGEGDYIDRLGNAGPFEVASGAGGREILFQPVSGYRWSQFVREVNAAAEAGEQYLEIEMRATLESRGEAQELSATCRLPVVPIVLYLREQRLRLNWVVVPCGMEAPPAAAEVL